MLDEVKLFKMHDFHERNNISELNNGINEHDCNEYLFVDLVYIYCSSVGISAWVECTHKLIVVNEAIAIHIKNICNSSHFQGICWEFYT